MACVCTPLLLKPMPPELLQRLLLLVLVLSRVGELLLTVNINPGTVGVAAHALWWLLQLVLLVVR